MKLMGSNPRAQVGGLEELPGKSNYFLGKDPKDWRTDIPTYRKVAYRQVYPGIDLVYYGRQGQLEYDFVVAPGTDPKAITLAIDGAVGAQGSPRRPPLRIDAQGDLVISIYGGEVRLPKPRVYQVGEGSALPHHPKTSAPAPLPESAKHAIDCRYVLRISKVENRKSKIENPKSKIEVAFEVAAYDHSKPLIIDPVLTYSTYLGGNSLDQGLGIAIDSQGAAYVAGLAYSPNFPTTSGAYRRAGCCGFVTKLNPTGSALEYSTYIPNALVGSIAVDASGNAYLTGIAGQGFPTTSGVFQPSFGGGASDAFVLKLNPTGSAPVYSSYLGGTNTDQGAGITVDPFGNAYVTGVTISANFPITAGAFQTSCGSCNNGFSDAFVTEVNATGSALVYSTYLGGSLREEGLGIALDPSLKVYVTGGTASFDFPTTPGAFQTVFHGGFADAFVAKFDTAKTGKASLLYSTYLGGLNGDVGRSIVVDGAGSAYLTGATNSSDFPVRNALQAKNGGGFDAFVTKLKADGSGLVYSTYLGGSADDHGQAIRLDRTGSVYLTGDTASTNFPTSHAFQPANAGATDVFLAKLKADGSALIFSSYLGGDGSDQGSAMAIDGCGNTYATGATSSLNFPTTTGAFQTSNAGGSDVFILKVPLAPFVTLSPTTLSFPPQRVGTTSMPQIVRLTNFGGVPLTIGSITVRGDFAEINTCGTSVLAGATCSLSVTFTPTTGGPRPGLLTIFDDDPCGQRVVSLMGVGVFDPL